MELPLSSGGHRFGWFPKPQKHTAFGLASVPGLKLAPLPANDYHLAEFRSPTKDQQNLGACTAFTGAEDQEAIEKQYHGKTVTLSPLFLYYQERKLNGTISQGDCGSDGETSCRALIQTGICEESIDPYLPAGYQVPPTPAQLTNASQYKSGAYHSLFTVEDVKLCIISGYRVRLGMFVYQSFENIGPNGLMPVPNPLKESTLGGHEILMYAFDDSVKCPNAQYSGAVLTQNHWGNEFGKNGDFWMPYELLFPNSVVRPDMKIQHLGPPWGKK